MSIRVRGAGLVVVLAAAVGLAGCSAFPGPTEADPAVGWCAEVDEVLGLLEEEVISLNVSTRSDVDVLLRRMAERVNELEEIQSRVDDAELERLMEGFVGNLSTVVSEGGGVARGRDSARMDRAFAEMSLAGVDLGRYCEGL